jgi:hypothetical protein
MEQEMRLTMSHVDDGTLHAYLDGELATVEREHLEAHLAGCPACQARLAEARVLVERANSILGQALPLVEAPPALATLRRPRLRWRPALPLAWAATVLLALGLGWYAHGFRTRPQTAASLDEIPTGVMDRTRAAPAATAESAAARPATVAQGAPRREANAPMAKATDQVTEAPALHQRGALAPSATAGNAVAPAPPSAMLQAVAAAQTAAWPSLEPKTAHALLGAEPATVPGLPVLAIRRNPADSLAVLVEQDVGNGVVIQLYESRADRPALADAEARRDIGGAQQQRVNERLARYVESLRIEIAGPLPADSLSKLLQLVR